MFISISIKNRSWKTILKVSVRVLMGIIIIISFLIGLSYLTKPDPRLRDQIKEKPLRVNNFHLKFLSYNKS